jgi:hypothetical protein
MPPAGLSVSRPSLTRTVRVAVACRVVAVGTNAATAFWSSTFAQCTLSTAGPASPTATVTVYRPGGTAASHRPGVVTPAEPAGSWACIRVASRTSGCPAAGFRLRPLPARLSGVPSVSRTQP